MATQAFHRAWQQATIERPAAQLLWRPADLRDYHQVRDRLGEITSRPLGVQRIPLWFIVGSVERRSDHTRGFMPRKDSGCARWTRLWRGAIGSTDRPPIPVYGAEAVYHPVEGYHRVSVAHQRGLTHIDAVVTAVRSAMRERKLRLNWS